MSSLPVLFVPGLNCTASLWATQLAALGAGRAVIVADHGRSETIAAIAHDVLADAPPRFALAGLSMGGYVAMEILRVAPERVDRLCLLDTQPYADAPEASEVRRQLIDITERGGFSKIAAMQYPKLVAPARLDDTDLQKVVRAMADATGPAAFIRQQKAILSRIDSRPSLAAIACPTTVVVGAEDQLTPPVMAREMAELVPGAHLVEIPDAGHLSPLERPDAVTAALAAWLGDDGPR
ncbi:MAG: alpha/beta fold hydrolase [Phyllobacteriaceae bacterium]|nr:alpha/beta fold hydrolase [Phyllobacteriaceae bacterium]